MEVQAKRCGRAEEEAIGSVLVINFPLEVGEVFFFIFFISDEEFSEMEEI